MTYSQKPLLDLLKAGEVNGENSTPRHIETVISNVFLFSNKVYKVYKNDSDFFNKGFRDISTKEERFDFTRQDFKWNNTLSPDIYTDLKGVTVVGGNIQFSEPDDSTEELMIIMKRVDAGDILYEKLMSEGLEPEQCVAMGEQLAKDLVKVRPEKLTGYNYYDLFKDRIKDLREWISSVTDCISKEEQDKYCDFIDAFIDEHKELYENELSDQLAITGDIHSHNASLIGGRLYLMDSMSPKEAWKIEHHLIPMYRLGADIWALTGKKENFDALVKGYENGSGTTVDRPLDGVFIMYAAGIMVSYLYMLQKTDEDKAVAAERYHKFIRNFYEEITAK